MSDSNAWTMLKQLLTFSEAGLIDWSGRPFSKSWSLRRLGWEGVLDMTLSLVSSRDPCVVASSESEDVETTTVSKALSRLGRERGDPGHRWIVAVSGKWIMELSDEGRFSFEYLIEDPPALKKGCRVHKVYRTPT